MSDQYRCHWDFQKLDLFGSRPSDRYKKVDMSRLVCYDLVVGGGALASQPPRQDGGGDDRGRPIFAIAFCDGSSTFPFSVADSVVQIRRATDPNARLLANDHGDAEHAQMRFPREMPAGRPVPRPRDQTCQASEFVASLVCETRVYHGAVPKRSEYEFLCLGCQHSYLVPTYPH